MKEMYNTVEYKGNEYKLYFNLNVMQNIQEKYGTVDNWADLMDGVKGETKGEPNAKAVIFGFKEMLNEGIDIDNEENGTNIKPFTLKQVGRLITEIGLQEAKKSLTNTVLKSTQSTEKNA